MLFCFPSHLNFRGKHIIYNLGVNNLFISQWCLCSIFIISYITIKINLNTILVCKTGEAKITEGFELLSRHVIHTVGPRYNVKYVTAAEGALYSSYRHVLQLAR